MREDREIQVARVVDDKDVERKRASTSKRSGRSRKRRSSRVQVDHIKMGNVAPATAAKLRDRLHDAATAFEAERFTEAERLLLSIQRLAPDVAEVNELLGLCYYRLGRWRKAIGELERFHELTGSFDQHPVIADCYRALKDWSRAEDLWLDLGEASPAPEIIEEGRIVQAGAMADQGHVAEAIRFLERAPKVKGKPGVHHLRRWYATADLYERAGDNSRARRVFTDIANADPAFGDAAERAAGL